MEVLEPIRKTGLCRMARNHVHMAIGLPGEDQVISGMRKSCEIVVEINPIKAVHGGKIPFLVSANNVVLTPGVGDKGFLPPQNFRSIFSV